MKQLLSLTFVLSLALGAIAQTEVSSKGFLKTRVSTTERLAFPAETPQGTEVYDTTTKSFWMWDGTKWVETVTTIKADTTNDGWKNVSGQLKLAYQANGTTARPDATAFVVNDNGSVGIGTTSPSSLLSLRQASDNTASGGPIRAENMLTGSYVRMAEFYAPNNTTAGNGAQLIFGTSGSIGNATEWRFRYDASSSNNNRGEFAFFGTAAPVMSYLRNGNVGIGTGTANPTARLHTNGTLRFQNLSASTANTRLLTISADSGNVATRNVADFFPVIIAGGNATDAVNPVVVVNSTPTNSNPSATIYTVTFTLTRESILDVSSVLSLTSYNSSGGNITSGYSKAYKTVSELLDANSTLLRVSTSTMSYTNHTSLNNPGIWHLSNSFKHRLSAGTYTLRIRGGVFTVTNDTEGARANFGASPNDSVDIIALPVN